MNIFYERIARISVYIERFNLICDHTMGTVGTQHNYNTLYICIWYIVCSLYSFRKGIIFNIIFIHSSSEITLQIDSNDERKIIFVSVYNENHS